MSSNSRSTSAADPPDHSSSGGGDSGDAETLVIPLPMDSPEELREFAADTPIIEVTTPTTSEPGPKSWFKRRSQTKDCSLRWSPTSSTLLDKAESLILSYVKTPHSGQYVDVTAADTKSKKERKIWTVIFNPDSTGTPLVMVHGLCAALGLWAMNIDELAKNHPVYTLDLLGFGKSSRPTFPKDPSDAELTHVEAIENWRKKLGLDHFVLLGHSMGGFISTSYALRYPTHVKHLILADPWGFPKRPAGAIEDLIERTGRPKTARVISTLGQHVNALSLVRAAGPIGPRLIGRVRPDLVRKFEPLNNNHGGSSSGGDGNGDLVGQYIYHCNAQKPSGEEAFRTMMDYFGWAKNCMINRIHTLHQSVPMSLIYGGSTWLNHVTEQELKSSRVPDSYVKVYTLPEAGHHVYVDSMKLFNGIVRNICDGVDGSGGAADVKP